MQRWYAASTGGDPYPLYAASNLGSFAGLIAYPLLVEPLMPVGGQSLLWSFGYGLLVLLVLLCAFILPRGRMSATQAQAQARSEAPPSWHRMGQWVLLAAVPSGLMLSTSLHLTMDIVAMPLLWVLPLGLYLLSFTVAFARGRRFADLMRDIAPLFILGSAMGIFADFDTTADGDRRADAAHPVRGGERAAWPHVRSASRARASHPLLSLHVGGRRDRRHRLRADRAFAVQLDLRASATDPRGRPAAAPRAAVRIRRAALDAADHGAGRDRLPRNLAACGQQGIATGRRARHR